MIIIDRRLSWIRTVLHFKGSVVGKIWKRIMFVFLISLVVTDAYLGRFGELGLEVVQLVEITPTPFALVGLAISIYLGFRNNASYDRFWEGRKLWGRMVNVARTYTRQVLTLVDDPAAHKVLVYRMMAYVHAFRMHLRKEKNYEQELSVFLKPHEVARLHNETNPPIALLQDIGNRQRALWKDNKIDTFHLPVLEASLTECTGVQGGCERINATPIPFAYTVLMHRIVGLYCLGLPFGLIKTIGVLTPLCVLMIAYAFFALDAIGEELEAPFDRDLNDLPLSQLSRMIEINLRERLGETELPPAITPEDEVLS